MSSNLSLTFNFKNDTYKLSSYDPINGTLDRKTYLFKNKNKTKLLLGELYKNDTTNLSKQQIKSLEDNNVIIKCINNIKFKNPVKIKVPYYGEMIEQEYNYINLYNIDYFCSFKKFIQYSSLVYVFSNYMDIINIINSSIKTIDTLINKCNIIHFNIDVYNLMVSCNYNNELVNLFNKNTKIFNKYYHVKSKEKIFNEKIKANINQIQSVLNKKDITFNTKITEFNNVYDFNSINSLLKNNKNKNINDCIICMLKCSDLYKFINSIYYTISSEIINTDNKLYC